LAGDDRRSAAIAFFEDFEEVVTSDAVEGLETPVVEDEQLHAAERPLNVSIAAVAAGEPEVGEQLGNPLALGVALAPLAFPESHAPGVR
jgi:hypothetical protein